tara:strand:- start:99 stop:497 length:399 start_codon:yes stop_codon:yes gene_type:complete
MAKQESKFGIKHIFMSAVIGGAMGLLTGVFVDPTTLAVSHFTEAGLSQTHVTQFLAGDLIDGYSDFMMEHVWDPLMANLGMTSEVVGQTAQNVDIVAGTQNMFANEATTSVLGSGSEAEVISGMDMSAFGGS